jgi:hypothetical protein
MDKHVIFRIVLIVLAAFILFALVNYYNSKQKVVNSEKFYQDALQAAVPLSQSNASSAGASSKQSSSALGTNAAQTNANLVGPSEEDQASAFRPVDYTSQKVPSDCFPKDRLTADDLLPKDSANSKWAQVNPAGQGDVRDQNFLTAGALVGVDTVGSSLRNASYDLRSSEPNPRGVWPIMNSTIEPDIWRKSLEIGGSCD